MESIKINSPVRSWRRVKMLTPRLLCENYEWSRHPLLRGLNRQGELRLKTLTKDTDFVLHCALTQVNARWVGIPCTAPSTQHTLTRMLPGNV